MIPNASDLSFLTSLFIFPLFLCVHPCLGVQMVATEIRSKIEDFLPYIPLIQGLRNPEMRSCHWQMLSDRIQINVKPQANLTLSRCLELGLQNHVDEIAHVAEVAGKEFAIEQVPYTMNQLSYYE